MFKRIISLICSVVLLSFSAFSFADNTFGGNTTAGNDNLSEGVDFLKLVDSSEFYFEGDYICGIEPDMSLSSFLAQFVNSRNISYNDIKPKTGATVTYKGTQDDTCTLVVSGDLNGDGDVNVLDITLAWDYIAGNTTLNTASFLAADLDGNGIVNVVDMACIRKLTLR